MTTDPKDAEIARLRMALAESEAAAEGALMILVQTQAERDAALAQVVALREAVTFLETHTGVSDALTERDRRDAQMRAEGRKEGMREAADVCVCIRQDPETAEDEAIGAMMCASAILAAAERGAGNV